MYFDDDASLDELQGKTIAAVGFGTQGMAQALNLRDSGLEVIVAEEKGSEGWKRAEAEDFEVIPFEDVAERANIFNLQIPDMAFALAATYNRYIKDRNQFGDLICMNSGYPYYYGHLVPAQGVDAVVAAAKSPGSAVRSEFVRGSGVPGLLAVHQDATGQAHGRGLALCKALGFTRVGVEDSTVEEEVATDLLGEHCAWGAIVVLLRTVFEVMVEAGYNPNFAFYESINESKMTTDLIHRYGLGGMLERISNTAAYGAITIGPKIIDETVKDRIRWALENIMNGEFDKDWKKDYENGYSNLKQLIEDLGRSQADQVGNAIRQRLGVGDAQGLTARNL